MPEAYTTLVEVVEDDSFLTGIAVPPLVLSLDVGIRVLSSGP